MFVFRTFFSYFIYAFVVLVVYYREYIISLEVP